MLVAALRDVAPARGVEVVVAPSGAPRYSLAEGNYLASQGAAVGADLLHLLDYRVPVACDVPIVATVHDLLRTRHPSHCYSDAVFAERYGQDSFAAMRQVNAVLAERTQWPEPAADAPSSAHEEFVRRMLAWALDSSAQLMTATRTVAGHISEVANVSSKLNIVPWGMDHLNVVPRDVDGDWTPPGRYVCYFGQDRPHKGVPQLRAAFQLSSFRRDGGWLVLTGRDFPPGVDRSERIVQTGEVTDAQLVRILRGAIALIHLTEHEGYGLTPLEALSVGTRVLVSDIPVLRETLGRYATFTDRDDIERVARDIDNLVETRLRAGERQARVSHARETTWRKCAHRTIDAYEKAIR